MSTTVVTTRSGRIVKKPVFYEPQEICEDDFSDGEESDISDEDLSDVEEDDEESDDEEDADDKGNLKDFVVDSDDEEDT